MWNNRRVSRAHRGTISLTKQFPWSTCERNHHILDCGLSGTTYSDIKNQLQRLDYSLRLWEKTPSKNFSLNNPNLPPNTFIFLAAMAVVASREKINNNTENPQPPVPSEL